MEGRRKKEEEREGRGKKGGGIEKQKYRHKLLGT
jgi:hypothetical protein